ncbi:hypothetical protein NQ317_004712 [Molorchus minor]|uniref:Uncharacterized protein n=1 Tax=Molorchus minor TaxID=1323400 RepID=A0ABQ9IU92_9CUCU|nr:hypothetical protein NQ317_004712 [Molorchus minor]
MLVANAMVKRETIWGMARLNKPIFRPKCPAINPATELIYLLHIMVDLGCLKASKMSPIKCRLEYFGIDLKNNYNNLGQQLFYSVLATKGGVNRIWRHNFKVTDWLIRSLIYTNILQETFGRRICQLNVLTFDLFANNNMKIMSLYTA